MERLKTFFKYFMWLVLFFIFSEVMAHFCLKTSSSNVKNEAGKNIVYNESQAENQVIVVESNQIENNSLENSQIQDEIDINNRISNYVSNNNL